LHKNNGLSPFFRFPVKGCQPWPVHCSISVQPQACVS
jgi:hypothetical protein